MPFQPSTIPSQKQLGSLFSAKGSQFSCHWPFNVLYGTLCCVVSHLPDSADMCVGGNSNDADTHSQTTKKYFLYSVVFSLGLELYNLSVCFVTEKDLIQRGYELRMEIQTVLYTQILIKTFRDQNFPSASNIHVETERNCDLRVRNLFYISS